MDEKMISVCWKMPRALIDRVEAMASNYGFSKVDVVRRCLSFGLAELEKDAESGAPSRVLSENPRAKGDS